MRFLLAYSQWEKYKPFFDDFMNGHLIDHSGFSSPYIFEQLFSAFCTLKNQIHNLNQFRESHGQPCATGKIKHKQHSQWQVDNVLNNIAALLTSKKYVFDISKFKKSAPVSCIYKNIPCKHSGVLLAPVLYIYMKINENII